MKKKPKDTTMTAREVGVLVKDLLNQFRIFSEVLNAVRLKLDSIFDQVGKLTEDVFVIKADIGIMKADIAEIKSLLKGHEKRIVRLEEILPK